MVSSDIRNLPSITFPAATSFSDAKSRSSLPERLLNKQQTGRQSIIIYILRAGPYAISAPEFLLPSKLLEFFRSANELYSTIV